MLQNRKRLGVRLRMARSGHCGAAVGLFPLAAACFRDWDQWARCVAEEIDGERN